MSVLSILTPFFFLKESHFSFLALPFPTLFFYILARKEEEGQEMTMMTFLVLKS